MLILEQIYCDATWFCLIYLRPSSPFWTNNETECFACFAFGIVVENCNSAGCLSDVLCSTEWFPASGLRGRVWCTMMMSVKGWCAFVAWLSTTAIPSTPLMALMLSTPAPLSSTWAQPPSQDWATTCAYRWWTDSLALLFFSFTAVFFLKCLPPHVDICMKCPCTRFDICMKCPCTHFDICMKCPCAHVDICMQCPMCTCWHLYEVPLCICWHLYEVPHVHMLTSVWSAPVHMLTSVWSAPVHRICWHMYEVPLYICWHPYEVPQCTGHVDICMKCPLCTCWHLYEVPLCTGHVDICMKCLCAHDMLTSVWSAPVHMLTAVWSASVHMTCWHLYEVPLCTWHVEICMKCLCAHVDNYPQRHLLTPGPDCCVCSWDCRCPVYARFPATLSLAPAAKW